jgi:hypothetical protein
MRNCLSSMLLTLIASVKSEVQNDNVILSPPLFKGQDLEESLMVLIPGGKVATEYYKSPMTAV